MLFLISNRESAVREAGRADGRASDSQSDDLDGVRGRAPARLILFVQLSSAGTRPEGVRAYDSARRIGSLFGGYACTQLNSTGQSLPSHRAHTVPVPGSRPQSESPQLCPLLKVASRATHSCMSQSAAPPSHHARSALPASCTQLVSSGRPACRGRRRGRGQSSSEMGFVDPSFTHLLTARACPFSPRPVARP